MARVVALDYGLKRTGIAVTDELQIIASGLTTVHTVDLMDFLNRYLTEEDVECLVIGKPKQMDNTDSESEPFIRDFIDRLNRRFPELTIKRVDERFTSKLAVQAMIDGGLKKKKRRDKSIVDTVSATLILQNYLRSIS
jgi:putative Holliday junction resolvase